MVVDALAPSRLKWGFLCNPGSIAPEAEVRKIKRLRNIRQWIHFTTAGH